jgi:hypothetical protein
MTQSGLPRLTWGDCFDGLIIWRQPRRRSIFDTVTESDKGPMKPID